MKKKPLSKRDIRHPYLNGGILCENFESTPDGKINGLGVFVAFNAWGFPCIRRWALLTRIFDKTPDPLTVVVALNKESQKKVIKLIEYPIGATEGTSSRIIKIPLQHRFVRDGEYNLLVSLKEHPSDINIKIPVIKQIWPEFTEEELEFVKKNRQYNQGFRATVQCDQCSNPHIFEEIVIEYPAPANIHRFPKSGIFECVHCNHKMHLKDIQGQIRDALKKFIQTKMRGV